MIKNQAEFTGLDLISIFENNTENLNTTDTFKGVSIDSRQIDEGNIFVAIRGEKIDAHSKIKEAFNSGASLAVVAEDWYKKNKEDYLSNKFIVVPDTIIALGEIATYHRNRFDYPVIAVAGSNGKTTTKELISTVLQKKYNVLKTYKNFNNQIGLPLMLLLMNSDYGVAVLEFGTNMPGEITILSEMAKPNYGLITNIGKEHLEQLIDLDGVEMEETFLFGYLRARGYCLINMDDERLSRYPMILEKYATYGTVENSQTKGEITLDENLRATLTVANGDGKFTAQLNTFGYHSAFNALAASCVGLLLDIEHKQIKEALEGYKPDESSDYGRMLLQESSGVRIINDCYNSNPGSLEVALKNLKEIKCEGRRIALLGDMLELGVYSEDEHKEAIEKATEFADLLITTGNEFLKANSQYQKDNLLFFEDRAEIHKFLQDFVKSGDVILVKGSRGMKLEESVKFLKENILK